MQGFFSKIQTASIVRPDGRKVSCNSCGLYKNPHSPKMKPYGNFEKGIMCIGECPSETDDVRGKPFQGKGGRLLKETFAELGFDLFNDCINLYAINCRPLDKEGKTAKVKPFEIECCRRIVLAAINQYKPKVIILLGGDAVRSVIGNRWKKELGKIDKWRGWTIPDQDLKTWICPVFSADFVELSQSGKVPKPEILNVWKQDLEKALALSEELDFPVYKEPTIHYIDETRLDVLDMIKSGKIAFDYESTSLKPHQKGHKIVCVSIATGHDDVFAFMMPKKKNLQQPFIRLMEDENVKKIAHNIKFEKGWTLNILGTVVKNWFMDTMLAAHVLDNRTGITGLKFMTLVSFGIYDYSSEISPILEGIDKKNSNSPNKLESFVKDKESAKKVLRYCALDSIFCYRLHLLQLEQIKQMQLPF